LSNNCELSYVFLTTRMTKSMGTQRGQTIEVEALTYTDSYSKVSKL